jgi:glycosyltransferase involved in cell wall biosynthesis
MRVLCIMVVDFMDYTIGGVRTIQAIGRALVRRGDSCRVIWPGLERAESATLPPRSIGEAEIRFGRLEGRALLASADFRLRPELKGALAAPFVSFVRKQIRDWKPDCVVYSNDGAPWHQRVSDALVLDRSLPLLYLAQTPRGFPFGPLTETSAESKPEDFGRPGLAVACISEYLVSYLREHAGVGSQLFYPPVYGSPPFRRLGRFDRGFVTMINASDRKGVGIFLDVARRFPDVPFAVVPTGGVSARVAKSGYPPNVTKLVATPHVEELYAQTRVLMAPSLWGEAFGFVTVEALARGIPVLTSDVGGLPEAKLGTRHVLPVVPMRVAWRGGVARPVYPKQNVRPWAKALGELLSDRRIYLRESRAGVEAADRFIRSLSTRPVLEIISQLSAAGRGATGRPKAP